MRNKISKKIEMNNTENIENKIITVYTIRQN